VEGEGEAGTLEGAEGWKRRGEGCVGALRMLVSGGLRQMSVPGGAVRAMVVDMFGFLEMWDGVDEKVLKW